MVRKLILIGAATVAVATVTGVGYAAIPGSDGTISACKDSKGALKVIDAEAGQTCTGNQQPLEWNQQGQPGPQGPTGPSGTAKAYASVVIDHIDPNLSMNVTAANFVPDGNRYCFGGFEFTPRNVMVTLGHPVGGTGAPVPRVWLGHAADDQCPPGPDQVAIGFVNPAGGSAGDQVFQVLFN